MKSLYFTIILLIMNMSYSQEATTIYLIRHAEKADGSSDTHLSEAGKGRAEKWAEWFSDKSIVGSSRVDLQACKLEYSIVSPK